MFRKSILLPWRVTAEFQWTFQQLFQEDVRGRKDAIQRLTSWNARYKKLPVAIICTKDLMELQLQMADNEDSDATQMACTMAITRFVNLLTEEQQKFGRGKPVHEVALKIGLPKWLVDIRHQGTHGEMPTRSVLNSALNFSLDWLKKSFWDVHSKEMDESTDRDIQDQDCDIKRREKIKKLLAEYMDSMVTPNKLLNGRPHHRSRDVLQQLNKQLRNYTAKKYLAYLLTQDGYLVPTPEQEEALGIKNDSTDFQSDNLPPQLLDFWLALLDFIHPCGLEHLIMDSIISKLSTIASMTANKSEDNPVIKYLLGWAKYIMKKNSKPEHVNGGSPPEKRHRREASEWSKTLKKCVQKPNKHSMELLPCLLELQNPRLEKTAEEGLLRLAKAMVEGPNGVPFQTNGVPSLDDIETMIESRTKHKGGGNPMLDLLSEGKRGMQERTDLNSTESWHISNDQVDWSYTPLGVLPWQPDDPRFFQLSTPESNVRKRKLSNSSN